MDGNGQDKNNFDGKEKEKLTSTKDKKDPDKDQEELLSQMHKELSPRRSVVRIIISIIAFLIWLFIGISPTVLFASYIQQFIGFYSFFFRNPFLFLIIGIVMIVSGVLVYFFAGILWWSAFHILWSIRWFYGFVKYRKIKKDSSKKQTDTGKTGK